MNRPTRRTARLAVGIAAGVGLGVLSPMLPVFGQTSPGSRCQQALLGAQSQIVATQSRLQNNPNVPVGVQSRLVAAQSRLAALSQICGNLPNNVPTQ